MHSNRYRSDKCICGSLNKVKNCCGKKPMLTKKELLDQVKMRDEARERIRKELAAKGMKPEDMRVTKVKGKQRRKV